MQLGLRPVFLRYGNPPEHGTFRFVTHYRIGPDNPVSRSWGRGICWHDGSAAEVCISLFNQA